METLRAADINGSVKLSALGEIWVCTAVCCSSDLFHFYLFSSVDIYYLLLALEILGGFLPLAITQCK